ncbi:ArsR family transcriptional regulator [Methanofollis aquaemaris]|uniref:ArsR family transcriptional regulator n=1 Tax=Methanofollis aquaemaris TaxID=126734 RepID=UPI0022409401|nr:ArsR family transcriptional regulator [Methanofollis aquaemaris]
MIEQRISLNTIERPPGSGVDEHLAWFCQSLGLTNGRDLENVAQQVVLQVIGEIAAERGVASETLAGHLEITPGRVNHHVRNLTLAGLLYRKKKLIYLRGGSMTAAVEEMRKDANRIFDDLLEVAGELDEAMGIRQS